jgi:uncharacterized protein (TIGR02147 family)
VFGIPERLRVPAVPLPGGGYYFSSVRRFDTNPISVFSYTDYRLFLKDFYEKARIADPKFSHRFISKQVGASSSGWFADLLKFRANLPGTYLVKLVKMMDLDGAEAGYFEALVQYNQAGSLEERNHHFKKLLSFKEMTAELVGEEKFEYYSKWYYSAIRELLFFHEFQGDYGALAKKLDPPIQTSQAREAVKLLETLGFLRKDAQGTYHPDASTLKKDSSFKSLYAVNFLKANMELGIQALEKFQKEQRHISGMTLSFSEKGFHKALLEIESLRKKLVALMEEDPQPEKVYQINLQLFPITQ